MAPAPLAALIVAAGRSLRAGGSVPKQYAVMAGRPVLAHTLDAFTKHPAIGAIQVVINPAHAALYTAAVAGLDGRILPPVAGGATRQASVRAGLEALAPSLPRAVLIHDAARPFVTPDIIDRVVAGLETWAGVIAALPQSDTLKKADASNRIVATVPRESLWRAQTPQGFAFPEILDAHRRAAGAGLADFTDDAAIAEWAGVAVGVVEGSSGNFKITTAEDLAMAEQLMAPAMGMRTGTGFDVHRFAPGDHVWLGGVKIAHTHRLDGHSDADVVLHALTDAVLGALGDGDIGTHFPPSDPQWKGAASAVFLADARRRCAERGGRILNVDLTVLCEAPRIGPHRAAMTARIAEILEIEPGRVGVKATTTEGLGFTGRCEGIAAMATATLLLP